MNEIASKVSIGTKVKNLFTLDDLNLPDVMELIRLADIMKPYREARAIPPFAPKREVPGLFPMGTRPMDILVVLEMLERSIRTYGSSMAAAILLGMQVRTILGIEQTSMPKGEGYGHHVMMLCAQGADIYAMRTEAEGAARYAAEIIAKYHEIVGCEPLHVPVMNCGDGCHGHPTQGLLDALHIWRLFGSLSKVNGEQLELGVIGGSGIKLSRTAAELLRLARLTGMKVNLFCSAEDLPPANWLTGVDYALCERWEDGLGRCHVLNWIRPQDERADNPMSFMRMMGHFRFTARVARLCRQGVYHMHAQPIKDADDLLPVFPGMYELPSFRSIQEQSHGGVYMRMAVELVVWHNRFEPTIIPQPTPIAAVPVEKMSKAKKKRELARKAKQNGQPFFTPIEYGTVIDHLHSGEGLMHYNWLLRKGLVLEETVGKNAVVRKLKTERPGFDGFKEAVVLEGVILTNEVMWALQRVFPEAVFNIIRQSTFEKYHFTAPSDNQRILTPDGILPCPSPKCISNRDSQAQTGFLVDSNSLFTCRFCERMFTAGDIRQRIESIVGSLQIPGQGLV